MVLLEDLHDDPRMATVGEQRRARVVEVRVGVVALPHLLDREVEDLRREPLPTSGSRTAMLELEAGGQGRLGDLELLGGRLRGRDPVLELVAGLRERLRERVVGVAHHPAEDLRRGGDRAERREPARGELRSCAGARAARALPIVSVASSGPTQVRAAALVLLLARLAVLVAADRDVLGAVVGGELAAAQREGGRGERGERGDELLGRRAERGASRGPACDGHGSGDHRGQDARTLEREPRLRKPTPHLRQEQRTPRRAWRGRAGAGS